MEMIFDLYQYAYGNQKIDAKFIELIDYMKRNDIKLSCDEVLVSGRILCDEIRIGDRLLATDGSVALVVKNIYAYAHEFDCLEAGMTCAIRAGKTGYEFCSGEDLYKDEEY